MRAEIHTRYASCPHTNIEGKMCRHYWLIIKEFVAGTARECAECAMDREVLMDFKEALDSVEVVKEPQVKRRKLQKRRPEADQAPGLAPRVEVQNPSDAALESWPAGEMQELVLPDKQAKEEHAKRGLARQHDHDGTEERGFWWYIRLAYGNR
jgi:hypothetical protein